MPTKQDIRLELDTFVGEISREDISSIISELNNEGKTVYFWFRDDDVSTKSKQLIQIMDFFEDHHVSLLLGVIPYDLTDDAVDCILGYDHILVGQHGYVHRNYSLDPSIKSELCVSRGVEHVVEEQLLGHVKLQSAFGRKYTKIFIPPFFEMDEEVTAELDKNGYCGFSSWWSNSRRKTGTPELNVQVDFVNWNPSGSYGGGAFIRKQLWRELVCLKRNEDAPAVAIGIVLHHDLLTHAESYHELEWFFNLANIHSNVILSDAQSIAAYIQSEEFVQV